MPFEGLMHLTLESVGIVVFKALGATTVQISILHTDTTQERELLINVQSFLGSSCFRRRRGSDCQCVVPSYGFVVRCGAFDGLRQ